MSALSRRKVLVLNKCWSAVGVATLQRAMTLLCNEDENGKPKARIITPPPIGGFETYSWSDWAALKPFEGEDAIITPHRLFRVPDVILLTHYDKEPHRKVHFCRKAVWQRDEHKCQYCGEKVSNDEFTLDHIIPRSLDGDTSWINCVLACYRCNSQKADRVPMGYEKYGPLAVRRKNQKKWSPQNTDGWVGPSPMKLLKEPVRPKFSLFKGNTIHIPDTWKHWIDKMYWEVPLENDMDEEPDDFDS